MLKVLTDEEKGITDTELVQRCKRGDRNAFRQLYQRYHSRVRSTLYSLCGTAVLDDLEQDVFLRAWQGLPKLRKPATFSTWLYRICWNIASDQRRRFAKQKERDSRLNTSEFSENQASDLMHLHYQELVHQGLQTLTLEHRVILVLHDLEDVPQKEIAKILAIPTGTVKSRLFHARSTLRQHLQQQGVSL